MSPRTAPVTSSPPLPMNLRQRLRSGVLAALAGGVSLAACQTTQGYTSSLELSGADNKGELLKTLGVARDKLVDAQREFTGAFELFSQITRGEENLPALYEDLQRNIDACASCVDELRERRLVVEEDALQLFASWSLELDQFTLIEMREKSQVLLFETQESYEGLLASLDATQVEMENALSAFRDYVLYFNHNLNPWGIQALEQENAWFVESLLLLKQEIGSTRLAAERLAAAIQGRVEEGVLTSPVASSSASPH